MDVLFLSKYNPGQDSTIGRISNSYVDLRSVAMILQQNSLEENMQKDDPGPGEITEFSHLLILLPPKV